MRPGARSGALWDINSLAQPGRTAPPIFIPVARPIAPRNGEAKRRTEIVGIFPREPAIICLIGAILLEQNDEWAVQRARYMSLEPIAPLLDDLATKRCDVR
jgi:mutator family transposase